MPITYWLVESESISKHDVHINEFAFIPFGYIATKWETEN